jgi:RecQ family ATP-dependent DNA helicase
MSAGSDALVPGLPLTREQALALPGMRRYHLVEFLIRWEHFGAARELLESLVTQRAGRFFYQYRLAQCHLASGDLERAKVIARELHAAPDTRAVGLLAIGDAFYVEGRLARAEEYYSQAVEIPRTRASAQRRLAWCLLHRRAIEDAAKLAEQVVAGKRPAQLPPAAVRLLAAVATAAGRAEEAAALRRELKSRWTRELDRLRASLELAAAEEEPLFEEPAGLSPAPTAAAPERDEAVRSEGVKGGGVQLPTASLPAAPPQPPATTGYVYPTARERRAAAEAAARAAARGSGKNGEPGERSREPGAVSQPTGPGSDSYQAPSLSSSTLPSSVPDSTALTKHLTATLNQLFGYQEFRPGQEEVVRHILAGRSVLATMPTGGGKSLCFQLPAMLLPHATVVISPLIALMQDQLEGLPPLARKRATVLNSALDSGQLEQRLRELAAGQYSLVYAAPERLRQRPFLHILRRVGVSLLVVDEAHCIALWGHDFRPDYLFLPRLLTELSQPPLLALTATATPAMQEDIRSQFGVPMEMVSQGVFRPNLSLEVQRCPNKSTKLKALQELCRQEPGAIIVYVNARARTEHLSQALNDANIRAGFYHAGLPTELREATQQRFMRDELRCLVATVAFGMGVDKPDIRLIIHHDLARSLEGYYQEAGRAGRDGKPARCVLFTSPGDKATLSHWAWKDRLTLDTVRRVYQAISERGCDLALAPDDLERETELDETAVRVAISVLERVGAVRRQYDLPRVCTLDVLSPGDDSFAQFVDRARLRLRQRVTQDTDELCAKTGLAPDEIEARLLDWVEAGWLEYRGSARGLRLEVLAVPDVEIQVQKLLREMEEGDEARLARLDEYVRTQQCRHQFLSGYFGHPLQQGCGVCDNCRGRP